MNHHLTIYEKKIPNSEKSLPIKINNKLNSKVNKYDNDTSKEYDISTNLFNPDKSSPPNVFINNLLSRINNYYLVSSYK